LLDPAAVLVNVETPSARLHFARAHQLAGHAVGMVEGALAVGEPHAGLIPDRVLAVLQFERVERHPTRPSLDAVFSPGSLATFRQRDFDRTGKAAGKEFAFDLRAGDCGTSRRKNRWLPSGGARRSEKPSRRPRFDRRHLSACS
jgi:hypothetical protein